MQHRAWTSAVTIAYFSLLSPNTEATTSIISNANGVEVHVVSTGANLQRIIVPDHRGVPIDVVLGYDAESNYQLGRNPPYFGGTIGRVANRIKGSSFILDNQTYHLQPNEKGNTLHGGVSGWNARPWTVQTSSDKHVQLSYLSPAGDQGFPGNVNTTISYSLGDDNKLTVLMEAETDATTPLNMAQHSYFNLNGQANGTILNHVAQINAAYVVPTDAAFIPTGAVDAVNGTAFDFNTPHTIGSRLKEITFPAPGGYDNNYALFGLDEAEARSDLNDCAVLEEPEHAATFYSPLTGRAMDLLTNMPGLQFYSGNQLDGSVIGKGGYAYKQYDGFAIESQVWPNFVQDRDFPGCFLEPGQLYRHLWVLRFYNMSSANPPVSA